MSELKLVNVIRVLRDLAHEEHNYPESMTNGHGRALLDTANLIEDLLVADRLPK